MIDSHAHIINEFYDNIDSIVESSKEERIIAIVNNADSLDTTKEVLSYSKKYNNFLFPTAGIHPQNITEEYDEELLELEELVKSNSFVAIGEIGLDYNWNNNNRESQKDLFIKQIKLSNKYNLPIIVHSRDAIQDTYDIINNNKCRGVIHCFSGSVEMAKQFVDLGFYLGIGGVLTFKNSKLYEVIEQIELNNIILETDSPFLSPEPNRGKTNVPSNVYYVAKKIASIKNVNVEDIIEITTKNAIKLFDLDI